MTTAGLLNDQGLRRHMVAASQQIILALLLGAEIAVFSMIGTNFWSRNNAFEVMRLSVEIGLLAVAQLASMTV